MHDALYPDDAGEGDAPRHRAPEASRPAADREVPLGPPAPAISAAVHAWLDGEASEASARRGGEAREVAFWARLRGELARRRATRPRPGFNARVMAAIR